MKTLLFGVVLFTLIPLGAGEFQNPKVDEESTPFRVKVLSAIVPKVQEPVFIRTPAYFSERISAKPTVLVSASTNALEVFPNVPLEEYPRGTAGVLEKDHRFYVAMILPAPHIDWENVPAKFKMEHSKDKSSIKWEFGVPNYGTNDPKKHIYFSSIRISYNTKEKRQIIETVRQ